MKIWQEFERSRGAFLSDFIQAGYQSMPQDLWEQLANEGDSDTIKIYRQIGNNNDYDFFLSVIPGKLIAVPRPPRWRFSRTIYDYVYKLCNSGYNTPWRTKETKTNEI